MLKPRLRRRNTTALCPRRRCCWGALHAGEHRVELPGLLKQGGVFGEWLPGALIASALRAGKEVPQPQ